ncbi:hypothetical protein NX059_008743 [Plenodomus lindquistii]|nr:hypothetical protein NX059_008743 [Plenodomus lindquistii]
MFRRPGAGRSKATPDTQCQKCLQRGHYSYECKAPAQERPYKPRPSRTQQLLNPKLQPKLTQQVPAELLGRKGVANEILRKKEEELQANEAAEDRGRDPHVCDPPLRTALLGYPETGAEAWVRVVAAQGGTSSDHTGEFPRRDRDRDHERTIAWTYPKSNPGMELEEADAAHRLPDEEVQRHKTVVTEVQAHTPREQHHDGRRALTDDREMATANTIDPVEHLDAIDSAMNLPYRISELGHRRRNRLPHQSRESAA